MKAAVYYETGSPDVLKYEEVPDPRLRSRGVIIQVEAISIEGGDTLHRLGGLLPKVPHIVGYQCAGTIVEVGAEVTNRKVGDRVVASVPDGSHAELVSAPVPSTWLIPEGLATEVAACIPVAFGTADDCLFEFGHLQAGESVLIQAGAGGVGLAAIQLAKRAGATVFATASSNEKLERLGEFGLDHGINYVEQDLATTVLELTDGRGVNLVVDPVGSTLAASMASLAYRGRISYVGNAGRDNQPLDVGPLMGKNQSITGVYLGAELAHSDRAYQNIARLINDVAAGELRVVIDRVFPLEQARDAHAYVESRQAFGRVMMTP